ncbi:MAG: hypothetical protein HY296_00490 [Thaumarchaeota archaeon]|nr:hypothetical protein [Nitrososphaerota archaeon]
MEKKVVAAALCNAGYSYRSVAEMLGGISYIGARDAFISLNSSMPQESQRFRREIAIDGCDVVLGGRRFYLWLARDIDSGEVVSFYGSPSGSAEDGARFLASIGRQCSNRPRVRLGTGSNFPRGLLNLDLYFEENATPSFMGRIGRLFLGSTSRVQ